MKNFNLIALLVFLAGAVGLLMLNKEKSRRLQDKVMSVFSPFIHASASVNIGKPARNWQASSKARPQADRMVRCASTRSSIARITGNQAAE